MVNVIKRDYLGLQHQLVSELLPCCAASTGVQQSTCYHWVKMSKNFKSNMLRKYCFHLPADHNADLDRKRQAWNVLCHREEKGMLILQPEDILLSSCYMFSHFFECMCGFSRSVFLVFHYKLDLPGFGPHLTQYLHWKSANLFRPMKDRPYKRAVTMKCI